MATMDRQAEAGDFTVEKSYEPPVLGRLQDGRFVKFDAFGNAKGKSPAWKGTDEHGHTVIESYDKVTIVDPGRIAPTRQQVEQLILGADSANRSAR